MNSAAKTMSPPNTSHCETHDLKPSQDLVEYAKAYAKERPDVVALWCFGVGFVLGWKLKPW